MGKRGDALKIELMEAMRIADTPLTAYDLLGVLRASNPKAAPTTVYRMLNTLTEEGLVHRLESINAYMLCQGHDHDHDAILSICDDCGTVEETVAPDVLSSMANAVGKTGFAPTRHVVEVHGTCSDCTSDPAAT